MTNDFENLMEEETKGLSKAEKRDLKVSRLNDAEFDRWSKFQNAKGDAERARQAHQQGGAGAPTQDDVNRLDDAEFRDYAAGLGVNLKGTNFEPGLSSEMTRYRRAIGNE